jgi:hypothetical protein
MGRSHLAYGWIAHTEKDSGKKHYWKETCKKAKEKMGECTGNSREILEVRNWKTKSLDRQVCMRYLKKANTRLKAAAL